MVKCNREVTTNLLGLPSHLRSSPWMIGRRPGRWGPFATTAWARASGTLGPEQWWQWHRPAWQPKPPRTTRTRSTWNTRKGVRKSVFWNHKVQPDVPDTDPERIFCVLHELGLGESSELAVGGPRLDGDLGVTSASGHVDLGVGPGYKFHLKADFCNSKQMLFNVLWLSQAFFTKICLTPTNEFVGFLSLGINPRV